MKVWAKNMGAHCTCERIINSKVQYIGQAGYAVE